MKDIIRNNLKYIVDEAFVDSVNHGFIGKNEAFTLANLRKCYAEDKESASILFSMVMEDLAIN